MKIRPFPLHPLSTELGYLHPGILFWLDVLMSSVVKSTADFCFRGIRGIAGHKRTCQVQARVLVWKANHSALVRAASPLSELRKLGGALSGHIPDRGRAPTLYYSWFLSCQMFSIPYMINMNQNEREGEGLLC